MIEKKINPVFEFLNSINSNKRDLIEECILTEKDYNPFIINRFLSGEMDTVIYANEMNIRPFVAKKLQYDFLRKIIRGRKRYVKWLKPIENEDQCAISAYYKCSMKQAREYYSLLSNEQIDIIKTETERGGKI